MNLRQYLLLAIFLLQACSLFSQSVTRKQVTALRLAEPLKIDGILDESQYQLSDKAKDFLQIMPYNGRASFKPTEVSVFYDDNALYIGAKLYDDPDSIKNYITTRDNIGVADYFGFLIDPNNDGLTAYEFIVTPANSQTDLKAIKNSNGDNEDASWDAVWQSATKINSDGWCVEYRIPYSALRFPESENPVWGVNFFRRIRRHNSNNSWNRINSEVSGFIQQSGMLLGIKNIKAPIRLSVSPHIATYYQKNSGENSGKFFFKGGIDLKYGLSDSHTLDLMLVPDFGQIQSDDEELNLSPYEIYYDEKRQFFVEGVELFNRASIFYSRRIGAKPRFADSIDNQLRINEKESYNPSEAQLINATKVSGRSKSGWGIGMLNAMTLSGEAIVRDTVTGDKREIVTQPFSNYNVAVVEKSLANNSFMSVINTNLTMANSNYLANVTGTEFQFKNKKQNYQLSGVGALSYRSVAEEKTGYKYQLAFKRIKGKFQFLFNHDVVSKTFNPNDMGYIQRSNEMGDDLQLSYNIHDPFWTIFKSWYGHVRVENTMLYSPTRQVENQLRFWTEATFKNNWWLGLFYARAFDPHDYFETRVENRFYKGYSYNMYEFNFHTDTDKKLSWNTCIGDYVASQEDIWGYWSYNNLWWKATPRFNFMYELTANKDIKNYGYVGHENRDSVYYGLYERTTLINTISMSYTFNTKTKIDFRGRHYWSWADYSSYYFLNSDGTLSAYDYSDNADVNFNAFNIDMSFRWEFAPGSELSVVWKNAIYSENKNTHVTFVKNITETFKATKTNSLSVKMLYYIDYNSLKIKR